MSRRPTLSGLELITVTEAAARLGTSTCYLMKLRRLTGIEPVQVGRSMARVFTRTQLATLRKAMLRLNPGHDFSRPRGPGRPPRSKTHLAS